jgi:ABC-2 type transport system permease protein
VESTPRHWQDILSSSGHEKPDVGRAGEANPVFTSGAGSSEAAPSLLRILGAFFSRDLRIQASYPLALALELLSILISAASIFFVGRLVGSGVGNAMAPYGGSYFSFALVGMALLTLQQLALGYFAKAIREGQLTGTLEAMLATRTSVGAILVGGCQWPYFLALLKVLFFLAAGLVLFSLELSQARLLPFSVFLALTVLAEGGLGLLSASFILAFQRGDPIRFVIGALSALLAGTVYPVSVLPPSLQDLSLLLPLTHGLEGIRGALLRGETLQDLHHQATALLLLAAILMPVGIFAFSRAIRYAKKNGTLGQY